MKGMNEMADSEYTIDMPIMDELGGATIEISPQTNPEGLSVVEGEPPLFIHYYRHNTLAQANDLIRSRQMDLSLMESKLIRLAISQIVKNDDDFRTYSVHVSQLATILNLPKANVYRAMRDVNESLMSKKIYMRDKEVPTKRGQANYKIIHWLSSVEYKDGVLTYRLSDELKPYLIGLNEMFTIYNYDDIISLPTAYSIRLYELLASWVNKIFDKNRQLDFGDVLLEQDEVMFAIEYLREFFDCKDKYTNSTSDFISYVIDSSIAAINQNTMMQVSYRKHRTSRRLTHLIFKFDNAFTEDSSISSHYDELKQKYESAQKAQSYEGEGRDEEYPV